jgi:hypothetical protein
MIDVIGVFSSKLGVLFISWFLLSSCEKDRDYEVNNRSEYQILHKDASALRIVLNMYNEELADYESFEEMVNSLGDKHGEDLYAILNHPTQGERWVDNWSFFTDPASLEISIKSKPFYVKEVQCCIVIENKGGEYKSTMSDLENTQPKQPIEKLKKQTISAPPKAPQ